jgi:hypothetical protein
MKTPKLDHNEYRCVMCGTVYQVTDFDAEAELQSNFPGCPIEQCVIVCDNCFDGLPVKEWSEDWKTKR